MRRRRARRIRRTRITDKFGDRCQGEDLRKGQPLNAARLSDIVQDKLAERNIKLRITLVNRGIVDKKVIQSSLQLLRVYGNYLEQHPVPKGEDPEKINREAIRHTKRYARANGIPWRAEE